MLWYVYAASINDIFEISFFSRMLLKLADVQIKDEHVSGVKRKTETLTEHTVRWCTGFVG